MTRSSEALWWSLFSAGGVLAAMFLPVLIVVFGLVLPFADGDAQARSERVLDTISWWPARLTLFAVVFLSLFHCAHRIRHIVMDLGWRQGATPLAVVCYGGAVVGALLTGLALARL